jgi:hypothetical protein
MSSWDDLKLRLTAQPLQSAHSTAVDSADWPEWTAAEKSQLTDLRQRVQTYGRYQEFELDRLRLEYVRWLVVHGKLSEHLH